jgi:hypothetical protein
LRFEQTVNLMVAGFEPPRRRLDLTGRHGSARDDQRGRHARLTRRINGYIGRN